MNLSVFLKKVKGYLCEHTISTGIFNGLSDEKYLKLLYRYRKGKKLNLENPSNYNEKLQWLKIHDHNSSYTQMVDKYEAKNYVKERIGEEYIINTIGVWNQFEEIDFSLLPKKFVLKCTHDSGGVVICEDKEQLDIKKAQEKLSRRLKINYFNLTREFPYKHIQPRIIAEELIESEGDLCDYKFLCFHGKVKYVLVCSERQETLRITFFDTEWNQLPIKGEDPVSHIKIPRPINLDKMISLSELLAADIPTVRVDFYENRGEIYFGELTFFHASGFERYEPEEADGMIGAHLDLYKVGYGK